jgi:hypothetical protein
MNAQINLFLLGLLAAVVLTTGGCKTPGVQSQIAFEDTSSGGPVVGDLVELTNGRLRLVCGFLLSSPEASCKSKVIEVVCAQGQDVLAEAITILRKDPLAAPFTKTPEDVKKIEDSLTKDFFLSLKDPASSATEAQFTKAVDRCMNHEHYKEAEKFAAEAATPEFQARAAAARRQFWIDMALSAVWTAGEQAIRRGVSWRVAAKAAPNTALSVKSYFLLGLCSGAANFAASLLESPEVNWNDDQCKNLGKSDSAQWGACLRVAGSICTAATGTIDIRNLGIASDDQAMNFFIDITNIGGYAACQLGGGLSRAYCGVINLVANQFHQTAMTGANDLAECYQTTCLGRCLGQMYASGGWTNNNALSQPRQVKDSGGEKWVIKSCCLCERSTLEYANWGRWKKTATEWNMSVIQDGDFKTGSCGSKEGKKFEDYASKGNRYYEYSGCHKVDVMGTSCALEEGDGHGNYLPVNRLLWDTAARRLSGRSVTKKNGIK